MSRSNELSGADGTRADGVPPPGMSEEEWRYYTRWGDDKRIRELALSVASGRDDYWGKAMAIQEYFHSEYLYSPGPASPGTATSWAASCSRRKRATAATSPSA
jgi:transglutaminase-like putative cysteine protease